MTKEKLRRRIERADKHIADLKENRRALSIHGHWSLGYWLGVITILEDWLDDIEGSEDEQ